MLILAVAGGVGHLAVQFASAWARRGGGYRKTGQPWLPARSGGALDEVDYHDANWPARVVAERRPVRSIWCWIWWAARRRRRPLACVQAGWPSGDGAH